MMQGLGKKKNKKKNVLKNPECIVSPKPYQFIACVTSDYIMSFTYSIGWFLFLLSFVVIPKRNNWNGQYSMDLFGIESDVFHIAS